MESGFIARWKLSFKEQPSKNFTAFPKNSFDPLSNLVDPGNYCEKLLFYDLSRRDNDIVSPGRNDKKGVLKNQIFYS